MFADDKPRCWWQDDPPDDSPRAQALVRYHDEEWGKSERDDTALFERLSLEGFQAGLSWTGILMKRDAFRRAFCGFDPQVVAAFTDDDRARLMADAGIVRNRQKIDATIGNAVAFLAIVREFGSFAAYMDNLFPRPTPVLPPDATWSNVKPTTAESDALSADLKRRGFKFVGSTIVYSFMQSVGIVDDHLPMCWRYRGAAG